MRPLESPRMTSQVNNTMNLGKFVARRRAG